MRQVRDGEPDACLERGSYQGDRVAHFAGNIRLSPCKNVGALPVAVDEHTLKRLGVLGGVGVSCKMRKDFWHIATVLMMRLCADPQPDDSREDKMSKRERTISRRTGNIHVFKDGECDGALDSIWKGGSNRGSRMKEEPL
jgi:hypothetical protein